MLDLYSGPGGLGTGFARYFDVSVAVDWDQDACNTYKANHRQTSVKCEDVKGYIQRAISKDFDGVLGCIGGPPCQEFTPLNQNPDIKNARAMQLFVMIDAIIKIKPSFALVENVARVPRQYKERAMQLLSKAGYHVIARTCQANSFGSVQVRRRWILTACKHKAIFPNPRLGTRVASEILDPSAIGEIIPRQDVLADLKAMPAGRWVARPGQRFKVYFVVDPSKAMPAVVNPTKLRYVRPDRTGYLSFSELKAAQGFPRDYFMAGNKASIGQQIANAVPVELASAFADAFSKALGPQERGENHATG